MTILVGKGSFPPNEEKSFPKIGTMNTIMAVKITSITLKTTAG